MKDYEEQNNLQNEDEITDGEEIEVKKPLPKLPIIIGAIVAAVAVIVIALVLILGGGSDKADDDECKHRDRDDDGICDKCDEEVEIDEDNKGNTDKDDDDNQTNLGCSHKYSDWEIYSGGNCEERIYKRVCSVCSNLEWKQGTDNDHVWEFSQTVAPTCVDNGYSENVCTICGKAEQYDIVPSNGSHDWETTNIIAPTCVSEGFSVRVCRICAEDETFDHTSDPDAHDWATVYVTDPTCVSEGFSVRVCTLCAEDEKFDIIPAIGEHEWESVHTNDEFYHWFKCVNCDEETDKIEHTYVGTACGVCGYNPYAGEYYVNLWVSERETPDGYSVVEQFEEQIADFMAANPGIIINATIYGVTEADVASQVVADVATAPDIYCFAQDQLPRLVRAGALAAPSYDMAEILRGRNDASSILAASYGDTIYAYPMTSDNGYYLYYDKSVITDPTSLEAIIADCQSAYYNGNSNYLFRYGLENGWYTASFFFGAGCHSVWETDENGNFVGIDDNFNSEQGYIALKGMQKFVGTNIYDSNADIFDNAAAVVSGLWNSSVAEDHFGENLGVTKLPTFTVDGETYQLGSFSGNKLMGIKPQDDYQKEAVLALLASYLTDTECQMERYSMWDAFIPSNLEAQASPEIQNNPHVRALLEQIAYATPQREIHGDWWETVAIFSDFARYDSTEYGMLEYLAYYDSIIKSCAKVPNEDGTNYYPVYDIYNGCYNKAPDGIQTYISLTEYTGLTSYTFETLHSMGYISDLTYYSVAAYENSEGYIPVTEDNQGLVNQIISEYLAAFGVNYIEEYYDCFLFYRE